MGKTLSEESVVTLDDRRVAPEKLHYVAMHKPKGVITTLSDPDNRATVKDLLPRLNVMLRPVGRLDKDSSGLLFFTNDGEFAAKITHARFGVHKGYEAIISGKPNSRAIDRLRKGLMVDGYRTSPAVVEVLGTRKSGDTKLFVELREGRNRQIRKMFQAVGSTVLDLKRVSIGPVKLARLAPGQCRTLSQKEVQILTSIAERNATSDKTEPVRKPSPTRAPRKTVGRDGREGRRSRRPSTSPPAKRRRNSRQG